MFLDKEASESLLRRFFFEKNLQKESSKRIFEKKPALGKKNREEGNPWTR